MDNNTSNNETQGYPKLQWSVFVKNGKDQQYVIRANDTDEFDRLKSFVLAEVAKDLLAVGANVAHTPVPVNQNTIVHKLDAVEKACSTCGEIATEKKGVGKNGKPYHAIFCSSEDKSHTVWL